MALCLPKLHRAYFIARIKTFSRPPMSLLKRNAEGVWYESYLLMPLSRVALVLKELKLLDKNANNLSAYLIASLTSINRSLRMGIM